MGHFYHVKLVDNVINRYLPKNDVNLWSSVRPVHQAAQVWTN
jgi:hypothetical protein